MLSKLVAARVLNYHNCVRPSFLSFFFSLFFFFLFINLYNSTKGSLFFGFSFSLPLNCQLARLFLTSWLLCEYNTSLRLFLKHLRQIGYVDIIWFHYDKSRSIRICDPISRLFFSLVFGYPYFPTVVIFTNFIRNRTLQKK